MAAINLLVTGAVFSTQAGFSALRFANAAIAAGHSITQVFFYQDGVTQGSALSVPLGDEFDASSAWGELADKQGIELVICVSAGERRGVLGDAQAHEFAKAAHNLHSSFRVEGLGVLHDACLQADRTVTFK
ncbi:sulfurtransferase complex subunit TusD [Arenicella xantha]|uniref:tRNA 2-thiouridine synthesizing protein D n=1 Tax=Arenicella xantha TaxID=644221 RepID=A0A395JM04_9GAMM|nr:sulfurtransferase complex subunit TusD [Arenicella xantha]RBP52674.1 tRNA 2-thiouridine synthesizing protein D [Arenicella xantha]